MGHHYEEVREDDMVTWWIGGMRKDVKWALAAFGAIMLVLLVLAIYGYTTGLWEVEP